MKTTAALQILILFSLQVTFCVASEPTIIIPNLPSSLKETTINSVKKDKNGFIWVGSQQGIYRLDGEGSLLYSNRSQSDGYLQENDVRGIAEDSLGTIVVATFSGAIFKFSRERNGFEPYTNSSLAEIGAITNFQEIDNSSILLTGTLESRILNSDLQTLHVISAKNINNPGKVVGALRLSDGSFLIALENYIYKFDPKINANFVVYEAADNERITSTAKLSSNKIILTINSGYLVVFDHLLSRVMSKTYMQHLSFSDVTAITNFKDHLILGTDDGLFVYSKVDSSHYVISEDNSHLSNNHISAIFNNEDKLWISTYRGLNVFLFSPFKSFDTRHSGDISDVLSFVELNDGRVLIGTYDGLFQYSPSTRIHSRYEEFLPESLSGKPIIAMSIADGYLWLGSWRGGIYAKSLESGVSTDVISLEVKENKITSIAAGSNGYIWVTTYNSGLYRIDTKSFEAKRYLDSESLTIVHSYGRDNLVAIGPNSFFVLDSNLDAFRPVELQWPDRSLSPLILSLEELPTGEILVGTKDKGIYLWDKAVTEEGKIRLVNFSSNHFLGTITANSIRMGADGFIWSSTSDGLVRIEPLSKSFQRFGASFGIQARDFNANSSMTDSHGNIYFGSPVGYTRFQPREVNEDTPPVKVILTSIDILGEERKTHRSLADIFMLEIDHSVRAITMSFSKQDYLNDYGHYYRHKLTNFDPDWIEDGERNSATYTNLPPGEYVFMAQAADSTGEWSDKGVSLKVHVLPPPWATWWAYTLYSIVALFLFWLAKRVYDNRLLQQRALEFADQSNANMLRLEDELQESNEYYDEQFKRLNRYQRETLLLIRDVVLSPIEDDHLRNKIDVLSILGHCQASASDPMCVDMRKVIDELVVRCLPNASVSPDTITVINAATDRPIDARLAAPLVLAAAELLENALTHAFEPSSQANFIEIELSAADDSGTAKYVLTVCDDGIGISDDLKTGAVSTGLAMLTRLAKACGGTLHMHVDVGTTARFEVPGSESG